MNFRNGCHMIREIEICMKPELNKTFDTLSNEKLKLTKTLALP